LSSPVVVATTPNVPNLTADARRQAPLPGGRRKVCFAAAVIESYMKPMPVWRNW
jgi:hypothetical protein